jgi:hypothetical protein
MLSIYVEKILPEGCCLLKSFLLSLLEIRFLFGYWLCSEGIRDYIESILSLALEDLLS